MSVTPAVWAFALILVIGLLMMVGIGDVWRDLFKGPSKLEALIDKRYPARK